MNNLPAERVLFAFAKPAGEDYLFRLMNLGVAAWGRRFAAAEAAVSAIGPRRRASIAAMIRAFFRRESYHTARRLVARGIPM